MNTKNKKYLERDEIPERIDWNKVELGKLDDEKIEFILRHSEKYLKEQRETFATLTSKSQFLLTTSVALLVGVFSYIITVNSNMALPQVVGLGFFGILMIVSIFYSINAMLSRKAYYTYETAFGLIIQNDFYKNSLRMMRIAVIGKMYEKRNYNSKMLYILSSKLNKALVLFVVSIVGSIVIGTALFIIMRIYF